MQEFQIDTDQLRRHCSAKSQTPAASLLGDSNHLAIDDLAELWHSDLSTDHFYQLACDSHRERSGHLETFAPLYLTNTCDAECLMCGMRGRNDKLERITATADQAIKQLQILNDRGMFAVALLTGEYRSDKRMWAMDLVNQVLHACFDLHFNHVLINIGSMNGEEFDRLLNGLPRTTSGQLAGPKISVSTFQETYDPAIYKKFMGEEPHNPRANFGRRIGNLDRAYAKGVRSANPGILVGLNPDIGYEITAFAKHARHLRDLGMDVYLSVPRLRRIAGSGKEQSGLSDDNYVRLASLLALALPDCKTVVTTRENSDMQQRLAPIVTVISAGSASVAPYTRQGAAFSLQSSQFEVIDQRPFEAILMDRCNEGISIANFQPS